MNEIDIQPRPTPTPTPTPTPPSAAAVAAAVSENIRERETFKYDALGATHSAYNDPDRPIPVEGLTSAADQSLTAYAQLAVYRLDARRALISLFDRECQHIVAEATHLSPLGANELPSRRPPPEKCIQKTVQDVENHVQDQVQDGEDGAAEDEDDPEDDSLWLCGTHIARSYGICEHVLVGAGNISSANTSATQSTPASDELPVSVVPDLAADPRFQTRPYIRSRPFNRFYAGVPIRTPGPGGVNIGVLCIFDTKTRPQGLSKNQVKFMQDMSRTVMGYLEYRGSSERYRISEMMLRGIGNFVEGLDSLVPLAGRPSRGSGHSKKRSSRVVARADVGHGSRQADEMSTRGGRPDPMPKSSGVDIRVLKDAIQSPLTLNPPLSAKEPPSSNKGSPLEPSVAAAIPTPKPSAILAPDDSSRCSTPPPDSGHSTEGTPQAAMVSQVSTADLQLAESGRVFAKAANIIRPSMEVDGVLFLDATVRSFGGLVGQPDSRGQRKVPAVGLDNPGYLSNDEDSTSQTHSVANKEDFCNVLGYSTPQASTIRGDSVPCQFEGLRDRTLQRLLRRYPHGKIFNFEEDGTIVQVAVSPDRVPATAGLVPLRPASPTRQRSRDGQESDEPRPDTVPAQRLPPTTRRQRWNPAESIIHLFPGARSVVLVPLWDGQKMRWAAGGFIWTRNPRRVFTYSGTLSFLRVFGLTVMAEIYRLATKAEESIKSSILGSISHELRSPLHGLVGAVELLHDSKLDAVQQNVLHIIETSGKTLVDTINHLLDYSKINSIIERDQIAKRESRLVKGNGGRGPLSGQSKTAPQTLPVELDCLVEEVVESVLAGYSHERLSGPRSLRDFMTWSQPHEANPAAQGEWTQDRVQIDLDIEPSTCWRFHTHPGAFRRIVMNLFGNSLKFNKNGFIKISLAQEIPQPYQHKPGATVLLTVSDTGKGISEDYLRNHLFTPFCQEDNFAPGTGLGLSLVRQITVNLGGQIKVASQVGSGTTITVSLPLTYAADGPVPGDPTGFKQDIQTLRDKKVLLRGFDSPESFESRVRELRCKEVGKLFKSQADVLESTCRNWLYMEVLSDFGSRDQQPDVIIHHDTTLSFAEAENIAAQAPCPVLFVCDASVVLSNFSCRLPDAGSRLRTFEFFSPPLGPRKLAKGLVHILEMWKAKQEQTSQLGQQLVDHITSAEVLPRPSANEQDCPRLVDDQSPVVPGRKGEAGKGMTLLKNTRPPVVAGKSSLTTDAIKVEGSPLPRPPADSTVRDLVAAAPTAEKMIVSSTEKVSSVLIVDDNAINLKILSAYMKKLNRPHVTAINGLESSEMYAKSPSDYCCILTDISMPIMDGLESARRIRQHERTNRLNQTPIIVLTGLAGVEIQQDAVASGVDMFLTRPVTLKRLVEALEAVGLD